MCVSLKAFLPPALQLFALGSLRPRTRPAFHHYSLFCAFIIIMLFSFINYYCQIRISLIYVSNILNSIHLMSCYLIYRDYIDLFRNGIYYLIIIIIPL